MYHDVNKKRWGEILEKLSEGHFLEKDVFPETILAIKENKNSILVISELDISKYSKKYKKLWQHSYHHDIIVKVEIKDNKLHITEFDGTRYTLDLETGKLVE